MVELEVSTDTTTTTAKKKKERMDGLKHEMSLGFVLFMRFNAVFVIVVAVI